MRVGHEPKLLELQTACEKIQQERAVCDANSATAQKSLDDVKNECAALVAATYQLLADVEAEKIELLRANRKLTRSKEQAQKQLNGAKAMVDSKQTELASLEGRAGDMQQCVAGFQTTHGEAEASIAACAVEEKRIRECMEREDADKKQAVLKAFDLKQEVETIKAQITVEKARAAELMQVCETLMDQEEDA